MIYTLQDFNDITFDGFNFNLPEETIQMISNLSLEVGSPSYVKTPVFRKRENPMKDIQFGQGPTTTDELNQYKRKKGHKNVEVVNDEDWEALRSFHTTKIEQKVGIEVEIDLIRSYLNKMTDKNFADMKNKIFEILNQMFSENENKEEFTRISHIIFEIASTNRFYSKIYADLYSELIQHYQTMKHVFQENFDQFMNLFQQIEYVDPAVDYDRFCKINKTNEKRKALSCFFVNLMLNQIISKEQILNIVRDLITRVYEFIQVENKKNEADELTENIVLLFKKEYFNEDDYQNIMVINNMNIMQLIESLANCKVKDFKSLTNKSIFKFMDMIDM